jgi:hypothetical protein
MKNFLKIVFIVLLALCVGNRSFAQVVNIVSDTSKVKVVGNAAQVTTDSKGARPDVQQQGRMASDKSQGNAIKQVKSGKPDLSKAKGARPPVIVRPTGTAIPKGVGKPAGVGKKGGR